MPERSRTTGRKVKWRTRIEPTLMAAVTWHPSAYALLKSEVGKETHAGQVK